MITRSDNRIDTETTEQEHSPDAPNGLDSKVAL